MKIDGAKWREILTLCFFIALEAHKKQSPQGFKGSSPLYNSKWIYPFEFLERSDRLSAGTQSTECSRCIFAPFEKGSEDTYHNKDTKI